jgi:hypothetical protein
MKDPYQCTYCDHRSTRRWNLDVHIKRKHAEYLLGRPSDRYITNNPHFYSNSVRLEHATVADSIGSTLQLRFQQPHLGTSQYSPSPNYPPVNISQTFANPIYRPMQIRNNQSYEIGLSQETILKIAELKRLVNKYPQFHTIDAGEIVKRAIYCSSNHDNKFLDDMLEQLRTIDGLAALM